MKIFRYFYYRFRYHLAHCKSRFIRWRMGNEFNVPLMCKLIEQSEKEMPWIKRAMNIDETLRGKLPRINDQGEFYDWPDGW